MKYDLVFEGGGAKGIVFVGALLEFEQRGHTFDRLLGTSSGAITAALLAAGYDSSALLAALNEHENGQPVLAGFMGPPDPFNQAAVRASELFAILHQTNLPLVPPVLEEKLDTEIVTLLTQQPQLRHIFSFVERGGWYSAQRFVQWLQQKLDTGLWNGKPRNFSGISLTEFFKTTGIELTVIASDTTDGRILVLNHNTAPACPLLWAVRMSMSIPFIWPEVVWQASWGTYRGRDITNHAVVDGGLLSDFPIELFVSDQPDVTALMGPKQERNILGYLIDELLPVEGAPPAPPGGGLPLETSRTGQRIGRLVNTALNGHDKMVLDGFEQLVVRLPAKSYGSLEFNMSDARRAALVAAGQHAMQHYFDTLPPVGTTPRGADTAESERVKRVADQIAARLLAE